MKITNYRIIIFLVTFLVGVATVYFVDGVVVPILEEEFTEQNIQGCSG